MQLVLKTIGPMMSPPSLPPPPPVLPLTVLFAVDSYILFKVGPSDFGNDLNVAYSLCSVYGARLLENVRATDAGFECDNKVHTVGGSATACDSALTEPQWYECFGDDVALAGNYQSTCGHLGQKFKVAGSTPYWTSSTGSKYTICARYAQ